ncbi:Late competence development protein ComFB [Synechococcus sp. PCC 7502]|uniref:late competence development ComFB family protein n=1 Tax=Synechococcus sp. PCC 7502 TaxID=1173263 RepID=UPI00029FA4CF|nr:late competence development ComFB family protein [Synechococcus sp. PCC 7502]AFY72804.1 Late competence development protein ComFB [Synechococcus sp. PCC 7502]
MYKNIIEDFVVKKARYLIAQQESETSKDIDLSAVAAIALNNLQPLYATTLNGWINQRLNASKNFHNEIETAVNNALKKVQQGDPLNSFSPIPESELSSPAYSLVKISQILGKENVRWREIPKLLELAIAEKYAEKNSAKTKNKDEGETHITNRNLLNHLKTHFQSPRYTHKSDRQISERPFFEQQVLDSYLLRAKLRISNVMEKIVEEAVLNIMSEWSTEMKAQVNTEAIVAFALNRLPPMYATSELGCRFLRSRAINQLHQEINLIVSDALVHVRRMPEYNNTPLPIYQLDDEMAKVIPKISSILKRSDVNADNLVNVLEEYFG